jgi:hypothetical protein
MKIWTCPRCGREGDPADVRDYIVREDGRILVWLDACKRCVPDSSPRDSHGADATGEP